MKKIGWILILVIWMVLVIVGNAQEMEEGYPEIRENDLFAQAAVLMDARSGRVFYGKNEEQILAMASTTKIMTCIVALENAELTEIAEVSAYASGMPKVKLGIQKGERYRLGDLLYSLMLESHNDAAVAIAEHIGKKFLQEEVQDKGVADTLLPHIGADTVIPWHVKAKQVPQIPAGVVDDHIDQGKAPQDIGQLISRLAHLLVLMISL